MIAAGLMLMILTLGQPSEGAAPAETVKVSMVAVEARKEKPEGAAKSFDPDLDAATRKVLSEHEDLDTFVKVSEDSETVDYSKEATIRITDTVSLHVSPLTRDKNGRISALLRLSEKRNNKQKNLVDIKLSAKPGEQFVQRGMRYKGGELVIVVTLSAQGKSR